MLWQQPALSETVRHTILLLYSEKINLICFGTEFFSCCITSSVAASGQ